MPLDISFARMNMHGFVLKYLMYGTKKKTITPHIIIINLRFERRVISLLFTHVTMIFTNCVYKHFILLSLLSLLSLLAGRCNFYFQIYNEK